MAGSAVSDKPVMVQSGTGGRAMFKRKSSVTLARALSITFTVNTNIPPALGDPLMTPVPGSRLRPSGRPFADHV